MELRLLATQSQKRMFAEGLEQARASVGLKFKEKSRSQLARIQLMFADLYGLFDNEETASERMIAGLAMHDLEMFPQSCAKPDLSHLPPGSVIEISDFWSLSKGAGMLVWCGAAVQGRVRKPRAVLAYKIVGPTEDVDAYLSIGFVKAGEPIVFPYIETADGRELWVQPLVLEGERMHRLIRVLSKLTAGADQRGDTTRVRDLVGLRQPAENSHFRVREFSSRRRIVTAGHDDNAAAYSNL